MKTSKKGFTLVELVVVIAILAILAAVAIPAVVNIINSASQSSGEADASTLNNACKTVYAGVKSGTINNQQTKDNAGNKINWAADKGATASEKLEAANGVTIDQVQAYNGTNMALNDFYVVDTDDAAKHLTKGTIVFWDGDDDNKPFDNVSAELRVKNDTTLGDLNKGTP